jgi:hypothetical protein
MRRIAITPEQLAELAHAALYGQRAGYGAGGLSADDLVAVVRERFGLEASAVTVRRWLVGAGLQHAGGRWRRLPAG